MTKTEHNASVNLASIVHESEEAAKAAAEAQTAAQVAQARAEAARTRVEAEQTRANEAYLRHLEAEYPEKRDAATTAAGEARQALEDAVRNGGDIYAAYREWVRASIAAWAVESAINQQRYFLGKPSRSIDAPAFDFGRDVGAIVDQHSMELQDAVLERIRERRAKFLSGQETS